MWTQRLHSSKQMVMNLEIFGNVIVTEHGKFQCCGCKFVKWILVEAMKEAHVAMKEGLGSSG